MRIKRALNNVHDTRPPFRRHTSRTGRRVLRTSRSGNSISYFSLELLPFQISATFSCPVSPLIHPHPPKPLSRKKICSSSLHNQHQHPHSNHFLFNRLNSSNLLLGSISWYRVKTHLDSKHVILVLVCHARCLIIYLDIHRRRRNSARPGTCRILKFPEKIGQICFIPIFITHSRVHRAPHRFRIILIPFAVSFKLAKVAPQLHLRFLTIRDRFYEVLFNSSDISILGRLLIFPWLLSAWLSIVNMPA
ncbi:hypothetical protein B0T20DRAFT_151178 [Sordaria brevicollis]|uniref:Uncharacterized protein n=1 Tax=Sordaria brevicollis TaxID=83679 RepID=A0AAE0UEC3_SORBR|nr:hypothetical protein B0T20DRAFT_151178 [Sordaria brevicollis]